MRDNAVEALRKRQQSKNIKFQKRRKRTARRIGRRASRSLFGDLLVVLLLGVVAVLMVLPLVYNISNAFKPIEELFLFPPRFFPINPTMRNFSTLAVSLGSSFVPLSRYIFNSVIITVSAVTGHVILASMCAYPLAKHNFRYKKIIFQIIILSLMFSGFVIAIPRFMLMNMTGMLNNYSALILPGIAGSMGLYLMKQFMEQIPDSLLESARIDGAGEFRTLISIVMPIVKPAWLTLTLLTFIAVWGDSDTAALYIHNEAYKPVPLVQRYISAGGIMRVGANSAFGFIMMLPPLTIFIITQSNVIETMKSSGMKD